MNKSKERLRRAGTGTGSSAAAAITTEFLSPEHQQFAQSTVVTTPSAVCLPSCLKSSGPLTHGQVLAFYSVPGASRVDPPLPSTRQWAVRAWRQAAVGASRSPAFWGSVQPTQQWSRDTKSRVVITPLLSA